LQVKEQKEMQLLEGKIREAASRSIMKHINSNSSNSSSNNNNSKNNSNSNNSGGSSNYEVQNELYEERLREYQKLADRYQDVDVRDTVDDAERNGG
jgi:hypothetical protein